MDNSRRQSAERYRQEAARVRDLAERMSDPQNRTQLLDIAHQYETLARTIEQFSD